LTMGDSIAWLLNIRGGDVDGTPIPFSYGVIHTQGDMDLFIEPQKVSLDVSSFLGPNVTVHPLDHIIPFLRKFDQVGFDPKTTPEAIVEALNKGIEANDPCLLPRACKNTTEQEGARQCHVVDGVALTKFLYFLYHHHYEDGFDEAQAVIKLRSLRAIGKHYQGDSFETISATGPHSAWCHYHTKEHTNTSVKKGDLYLVDSGGQYLNGTTDVTRTIVIGGHGTPEQKDHYTRVLKGYIALDTIKFPKGTSGVHLDVLVRQYLWEVGLNFPHATGHGVGSYLSVHEGPQCITPRLVEAPLMPGMILSNEPGVYREGHYGIRLENLVLVRECPDLPGFLEFENLTWAPFDMNLIDMGMLSLKEKQWLKDYHKRLIRVLGDGLSFEEKEWVEHSFSVNEDKLI
jgi:Xaa-Pro aminopeptidase